MNKTINASVSENYYVKAEVDKQVDALDYKIDTLDASEHIPEGSITNAMLGDGCVTSEKIEDGSIKGADLADKTITGSKIGDGEITSNHIQDGAVTTEKLAQHAVTSEKIEDGTIQMKDLNEEVQKKFEYDSELDPGSQNAVKNSVLANKVDDIENRLDACADAKAIFDKLVELSKVEVNFSMDVKTINDESLIGEGNIVIPIVTIDGDKPATVPVEATIAETKNPVQNKAVKAALDLKADITYVGEQVANQVSTEGTLTDGNVVVGAGEKKVKDSEVALNTLATKEELATQKTTIDSEVEAKYETKEKVAADKTELEGKIDKKVDRTTYDAKMEELDAAVADVASKKWVSENYTSTDDLTKHFTEVECNIKKNADAIETITNLAPTELDTFKEVADKLTEVGGEVTELLANTVSTEVEDLTSDKIVLGNGTKTVKISETGLSDLETVANATATYATKVELTAEQTRATEAEGTLTTNLAAEVTRARGAEETLTTNLTAETTRATTVEQKLTDEKADKTEVETAKAEAIEESKKYTDDVISASDWYGIEWDESVAINMQATRIGNMNLHRTLPVQSQIKGCILDDDGNVVEYLPNDTWIPAEGKADIRDGSKGQVMVELPEFWIKFEMDGDTKRRVKISAQPQSGFIHVNKCYVSAYEACLDLTSEDKKKLASVVNTTGEYYGHASGTKNVSYRGYAVSSVDQSQFRTFARNRKDGDTKWNMYLYSIHKEIYWLFVTEYCQFNSQAAVNGQLTPEGYHQGGLGNGVTNVNNWQAYNSYYAVVPCGASDSLGNGSGEVICTPIERNATCSPATVAVPRYRGIENPFGHLWKWSDGILLNSAVEEHTYPYYLCDDTSKLVSTDPSQTEGYVPTGDAPLSNGFIKSLVLGERGDLIPKDVNGGSDSTYYCDYYYQNGAQLRGVLLGGRAGLGTSAGLGSVCTDSAPTHSRASVGSRLCYVPTAKTTL